VKLRGYLALALVLIFVVMSVGSQFGLGVGAAAAAAVGASFGAGKYLDKRAPGWPLRHEAGAILIFWMLMAGLQFCLLAGVPVHVLTRWPAWACSTGAAVLSTAWTAGVWPAQRRYYAVQRALAAQRKKQQKKLTRRSR
jgi:hypothetical protein